MDAKGDFLTAGKQAECEIEGIDFSRHALAGAKGAGAGGVASAMGESGRDVTRYAIPGFTLAIVDRRSRRRHGSRLRNYRNTECR